MTPSRRTARYEPKNSGLPTDKADALPVSMVKYAGDTVCSPATLGEVLQDIKTGRWKDQIEALRTVRAGDAGEYAELKKNLPSIIFAGRFERRAKTGLLQHSGLTVFDLDHIPPDKMHEIRKRIEEFPFTLACFASPGGEGLKFLVRLDPIPKDAAEHEAVFEEIRSSYEEGCKITLDPSGKDVSRLCFASWDANLYCAPAALLFTWSLHEVETAKLTPAAPKRGQESTPQARTPATAAYVQAALDNELEAVRQAPEGGRNHQLNKSAFSIGQFVGGGCLSQTEAESLLADAAEDCGLSASEAQKTIRSGVTAGMNQPRQIPPAPARGADNPTVAAALAGGAVLLPSNETPIREAAQQIFQRLGETNCFFWRGGAVHEITDGALVPIRPESLRTRIESLGPTVALLRDKDALRLTAKRPSEADCKAILAAVEARELLPPVEVIAKAPVLFLTDSGAAVRAGGGYCQEAAAYIHGKHKPVEITPADAAAELADLLRDFCFLTPGDKARALSFLVSVALRLGGFIRDNRCPLFVIEADQSQTGKGTLIDAITSIYGERPEMVSERSGGVGGFDESIQQRLIDGSPIISLDNLRGRVASAYLEAILTAPGRIGCRVPHRGEVSVDPHRFLFCATSNGMQSTPDLANRSIIIRLRKRPENYRFHKWADGGLLDHIRTNKARLLSAVHAIVEDWHKAGAIEADVFGHDFRGWHSIAQAIVSRAWPDAGQIIDQQHKETLQRMADPARAWLRDISNAVNSGDELCASELVELSTLNELTVPGCPVDADETRAAKAVGVAMKRIFRDADAVEIDGVQIERSERRNQRDDGNGYKPQKVYRFAK